MTRARPNPARLDAERAEARAVQDAVTPLTRDAPIRVSAAR